MTSSSLHERRLGLCQLLNGGRSFLTLLLRCYSAVCLSVLVPLVRSVVCVFGVRAKEAGLLAGRSCRLCLHKIGRSGVAFFLPAPLSQSMAQISTLSKTEVSAMLQRLIKCHEAMSLMNISRRAFRSSPLALKIALQS